MEVSREKRRDLTQSYDKAPTPAEMSKWQSDNTNNATKSSISYRLLTDLGRSIGVTTATQLVRFTGFTHLPTHRNSCVIEDKNKQLLLYSDIKVV